MENMTGDKYYKIWLFFSLEVEKEFNQLIHNIEKDCLLQLEKSGYSYKEVMKMWDGYRGQLVGLIEKTDEKWINNDYTKSLISFSHWDETDDKTVMLIIALKEKLHSILDRFQAQLEGKLAQNIFRYVSETCCKNFHCRSCDEPLNIDKDVLKKHDVICPKCNAKTEYNPGDEIDSISEILIEKIIVLKCIQEYNYKEQIFEKLMNGISKNRRVMIDWDDFKAAYFTFYRKYIHTWKQLSSNMQNIEDNWKQRQDDYKEFEILYRDKHNRKEGKIFISRNGAVG